MVIFNTRFFNKTQLQFYLVLCFSLNVYLHTCYCKMASMVSVISSKYQPASIAILSILSCYYKAILCLDAAS